MKSHDLSLTRKTVMLWRPDGPDNAGFVGEHDVLADEDNEKCASDVMEAAKPGGLHRGGVPEVRAHQ